MIGFTIWRNLLCTRQWNNKENVDINKWSIHITKKDKNEMIDLCRLSSYDF